MSSLHLWEWGNLGAIVGTDFSGDLCLSSLPPFFPVFVISAPCPHSVLPDCLSSTQCCALAPVLPLQSVFPNHLNPWWPPLPLRNWDRFFYLQPFLEHNDLVFCWSCCFVCIYLVVLTDSSLKSWAGLYYFPKPQLQVKWWHRTRAFDSCWVTWAELGRSCDPPRGCWVYILQAGLMSSVYSRLFSVGPENTGVLSSRDGLCKLTWIWVLGISL